MNKERLELLREALVEQQQNEKLLFNMYIWGQVDTDQVDSMEHCNNEINQTFNNHVYGDNEGDCLIVSPNVCCSAACALGTAALYPPLFDQGLRLVNSKLRIERGAMAMVYFDGYMDEKAAMRFFDISFHDAGYLFSPDVYYDLEITEQHVIDRIDELLARKET